MSVLAITMSEESSFDSLRFVLEGTRQNLESWGNEYLRSLSGEVSAAYLDLETKFQSTSHLDFLVDIIAPYQMLHNEETETVDLLIEVDQLSKVVPLCHE